MYTAIVKTGTGRKSFDGAGTDCKVTVKIYGKSRQTGLLESTDEIQLKRSTKRFKNKFESGE